MMMALGFMLQPKVKTNLDAAPSDIVDGCINYDYTHVVWYNK